MKDERLYLHHMLERCERVAGFIASGRDAFFASEQQQDAVIRNLEVIGEAAKHVGPEWRAALPEIAQRLVIGAQAHIVKRVAPRAGVKQCGGRPETAMQLLEQR